MKNNKLEFKGCWLVDSWSTEIKTGKGVKVKEGGFGQSDKVLFFNTKHNDYVFVSSDICYWDLESATVALKRSRQSYLTYLKEEQEKRQIQIKELEG